MAGGQNTSEPIKNWFGLTVYHAREATKPRPRESMLQTQNILSNISAKLPSTLCRRTIVFAITCGYCIVLASVSSSKTLQLQAGNFKLGQRSGGAIGVYTGPKCWTDCAAPWCVYQGLRFPMQAMPESVPLTEEHL